MFRIRIRLRHPAILIIEDDHIYGDSLIRHTVLFFIILYISFYLVFPLRPNNPHGKINPSR